MVPDHSDIKSFAGHLWRSILMFGNGASSAGSSKHINILCHVCGLFKCCLGLESQKIMKSGWGNWKSMTYYGNQIYIAVGELPVQLLA